VTSPVPTIMSPTAMGVQVCRVVTADGVAVHRVTSVSPQQASRSPPAPVRQVAPTRLVHSPVEVVRSPALVSVPSPQLAEPGREPSGIRKAAPQIQVQAHSEFVVRNSIQKTIDNAVAMLPPSPPNTLSEFLQGVIAGELVPAMCLSETRIDTARYWEKRRVQNSLRRLLEALQERFGQEEWSQEPDSSPTVRISSGPVTHDRNADLGTVVFNALRIWKEHQWQNGLKHGSTMLGSAQRSAARQLSMSSGLDEQTFTRALDEMNIWPMEMSDGDRTEVYLALLVPSSSAVRGHAQGTPLSQELTRRMFCEGLAHVPYNVPDFPVPTHLLLVQNRNTPDRSRLVDETAQSVASIFCKEQTGLDHVKDYFLCGLLSLEEIQVALPQLLPQSLIDEACKKIIRTSAKFFSQREWQSLVASVRLNVENQQALVTTDPIPSTRTEPPLLASTEPSESAGSPPHPPVTAEPPVERAEPVAPAAATSSPELGERRGNALPTLASPTMPYRQERPPTPEPQRYAYEVEAEDERTEELVESQFEAPAAPSRRQMPVTEPLPYRELLNEEPVTFTQVGQSAEAGDIFIRVVNWNTGRLWSQESAASATTSGGGHQADQGAGTLRLASSSDATPTHTSMGRCQLSGDDPVAWISLEMQNECVGPFLARAFVRCCQLYEAHAVGSAEVPNESRESAEDWLRPRLAS